MKRIAREDPLRKTKARRSMENARNLLHIGIAELRASGSSALALKRVNSAIVDLEDARFELTPKKKDPDNAV